MSTHKIRAEHRGKKRLDDLPVEEAILIAWTTPGRDRDYQRRMRNDVRFRMPLLARALDRAARSARETRTQGDTK